MSGCEDELQKELVAATYGTPQHLDVLNSLANLKLEQGATEEAQKIFRKLAEVRGDDLKKEAEAAAASGGDEKDDDDWENDDWENATEDNISSKLVTPPPKPARAQAPPTPYRTVASPSPVPARQPAAATAGQVSASKGVVNGDADDHDGPARAAASGPQEHVLEVYGLNLNVKTQHLEEFVGLMCELLEETEGTGLDGVGGNKIIRPSIKWLDDEKALIVCPNTRTAKAILSVDQTDYKLRAFSEASDLAKQSTIQELLPPKERPATTAAVAKRLLSHALGIPGLRDKSAEQKLAAKRREAKEVKNRRHAAAEEVWGDD